MRAAILSLLAGVGLVSAHFKVEYPAWRGDTLADNTTYDQWDYPCGGVPYGAGNKTDWPIQGGAVSLDLHHPWTYVYINLGLGENATNFNISLTPQLLNVTGKGTFCIPALPIPATIADGQSASLQVVTNGQSGSALYNCADVVLRSSAQPPADGVCTNSTGVTAAIVGQATTTSPSPTPTPTTNGVMGAFGSMSQAVVLSMVVAFTLIFV